MTGLVGPKGAEFGMRTVGGVPYPESECRPCKADRARERRRLRREAVKETVE